MDAFILPAPWLGVGSASRVSVDSNAMVLDGKIQLGAGAAAQFLTTATKVWLRLNAIETAFNSHIHTGVTSGVAVSGPPQPGDEIFPLTDLGDLEASSDIRVKV
jgi:hypothetical protein